MSSIELLFALHHHQPVGNFESAFEEVYEKCYWPLLTQISEYEDLQFNLSYSGPVLSFFEEKHPEYLDLLRQLIARNQVEVLCDGFFEPVLAEVDEDDRRGQIRLMQEWHERVLGYRAKGVWLAEGVWEPSLARTFHEMGLGYTMIRGVRFVQSGVKESDLGGHYVTEHLGHPLMVFPNDVHLLKKMPFGEVDDLFLYLKRLGNRKRGKAFTVADVAERWGAWAGSYEGVQESGYLRRLLEEFSKRKRLVKLRRFSDYLEEHPVTRRCYIPPGARWEMGAWSLPDESRAEFAQARKSLQVRHDATQFTPFFRGGSYAGFRARYHEALLMEKKGLWLKLFRNEVEDGEAFQRFLWEGQCNTAYWFGTSGGLYQGHLREAVWKCFLSAERMAAKQRKGWFLERYDFDADGIKEYLVTHPEYSFGVSADYGGCMYEFSVLDDGINFLTHLTRRAESLEGLEEESTVPQGGRESGEHVVIRDDYRRYAFQERFVSRKTRTQDFMNQDVVDLGDFLRGVYEVEDQGGDEQGVWLALKRRGVFQRDGEAKELLVKKRYSWSAQVAGVRVCYEMVNEGDLPIEGRFVAEVNCYLACGDGGEGAYLEAGGSEYDIFENVVDESGDDLCLYSELSGVGVKLRRQGGGYLGAYPILSSASREDMKIQVRQGNCLLVGWDFCLEPKGGMTMELQMEVEEV